jgi:hypothetical protein
MPRKSFFQKKIIKNANQYNRTELNMETEESSVDETPYDPFENIEMNNERIET